MKWRGTALVVFLLLPACSLGSYAASQTRDLTSTASTGVSAEDLLAQPGRHQLDFLQRRLHRTTLQQPA